MEFTVRLSTALLIPLVRIRPEMRKMASMMLRIGTRPVGGHGNTVPNPHDCGRRCTHSNRHPSASKTYRHSLHFEPSSEFVRSEASLSELEAKAAGTRVKGELSELESVFFS